MDNVSNMEDIMKNTNEMIWAIISPLLCLLVHFANIEPLSRNIIDILALANILLAWNYSGRNNLDRTPFPVLFIFTMSLFYCFHSNG